MKVKSSLLVLLAGASVMFSAGCSSKNYVRQQTQPIIDKTNTLDEQTAKNSRDIRDVDSRASAGIQGVNGKAADADQKAVAARGRADQAATLAAQANTRVDALQNQVANLDNYRPVLETSVHFAFNKADLTPKAKTALDQLVAEIPNTKGYLVVVEGDTDAVGSAKYNYKLSERRADAVVHIFPARPFLPTRFTSWDWVRTSNVADNKTSEGRAQNRRVDVRLMTNTTGQETPASAQSAAPNPSR